MRDEPIIGKEIKIELCLVLHDEGGENLQEIGKIKNRIKRGKYEIE